jgi:hypothetical protein
MTPQRISDFFPLALQSLTQPRVGLRTILSIPSQRSDLINAGWLVIILNLILTASLTLFGPIPPETPSTVPLATSAIMQALSLFGGAFIVHRVGAFFGGTGNFDGSLKLIIWVNFILFLMQLPILLFSFLGQEIVALAMILVLVIAITQLTATIMELHGFTEVLPVLFGILGSSIAFGIALLFALGLLGVNLPTNV